MTIQKNESVHSSRLRRLLFQEIATVRKGRGTDIRHNILGRSLSVEGYLAIIRYPDEKL